jgi:hypothetical protein
MNAKKQANDGQDKPSAEPLSAHERAMIGIARVPKEELLAEHAKDRRKRRAAKKQKKA